MVLFQQFIMNEKQLWKYFIDRQTARTRPFDRDFIWVRKRDFEHVRLWFTRDFNVVHSGKSFRSGGLFLHIHAVDQAPTFLFTKILVTWHGFSPWAYFTCLST